MEYLLIILFSGFIGSMVYIERFKPGVWIPRLARGMTQWKPNAMPRASCHAAAPSCCARPPVMLRAPPCHAARSRSIQKTTADTADH